MLKGIMTVTPIKIVQPTARESKWIENQSSMPDRL